MLPVVLGGIALAAVGYGLKEHCENNIKRCESDRKDNDEADVQISDVLDIQKLQKKISIETLAVFRTLLMQIPTFDELKLNCKEVNIKPSPNIILSSQTISILNRYTDILLQTSENLQTLFPKLELIASDKHAFTENEQKDLLHRSAIYATIIKKLLSTKLLRKNGQIAKKLHLNLLNATQNLIKLDILDNVEYENFYTRKMAS